MDFRTGMRCFLLGFTFAALTPLAFSQAAPEATPSAPAPSAPAPTAPAPSAAVQPNANPFPPTVPADFTGATPTKQEVDAFLHASWGYDPSRIWQVQAILKTPVEGVSKIVVLVADKGQPKEQVKSLVFFSLPDGKHIVAGDVLPFGSKPFEQNRKRLRQATGPSQGAASTDLNFVEFADFECPHCKEAQATVAKLLADYPSAHFIFENFPLVQIHSEAFKASAYGVCVAKESGNSAFFKFVDAIFDAQGGLTPQSSDATLKEAVTKAGGDPAKAAACSSTPETKDAVNAQLQLGQAVGVDATPTLFVNGRGLPVGAVPYETLRSIVDFQAKQDGISLPPRAAAAPPPSMK